MSNINQEDVERWRTAVYNEETLLGLDEWFAAESPEIVSETVASELQREVSRANTALREFLRPLAVYVVGDWAIDDREADKQQHRWNGKVDRKNRIIITVSEFPADPNETTVHTTYRVDSTGTEV